MSRLASSSTARVSKLMSLMTSINALFLEYGKKYTDLDKWCQEYLVNLLTLKDFEGRMIEVRRLIGREDLVVVDVKYCERTTSHPSQNP
ncbi:hypothetical protein AMTR_s00107p00080340 [Amborella trichopoda]|uniref:Uncharacterized protein n=1 Tax=Amborella trichopoda TaxID=13333 RepID=W1NYC7_AMBTC|nr:hypothetical protein AMTR_s00107p00080340 [Amborella trichopoda]